MRRTETLLVLFLIACEGPEGPAGADGKNGANGSNGSNGEDGADGADGEDGEHGADGDHGEDGTDGTDGTDGEDGEDGEDGAFSSLSFAPIELAETDAQKRSVIATDTVWVNGEASAVDYTVLLRSGDSPDGVETYGQITDQDGAPIIAADGSAMISNYTDFSSILPVGDRLFGVSHFEGSPGALYVNELDQDLATGALSVLSSRVIDMSAWGGIWTPCAGTVSPWGTHLGSEEYEPDARLFAEAEALEDVDPFVISFSAYFGLDVFTDEDEDDLPDAVTLTELREVFDPYRYGFPTEITVNPYGVATAVKHMGMARVSSELSYVMPDQRTVYITDDGTNDGFYMFIADTAADLSAGTLYAMKWYQTSDERGGSADIDWIELGHASDDEIAALVDAGVTFSDIFDTASPETDEDGASVCPDGFTSINAGAWGSMECLALREGMELAARGLETRRYAAMLGATTELRKSEGLTYDEQTFTLYMSISELSRGMEDNAKNGSASTRYDGGGSNDIRLPYNLCGVVYGLDVAPDRGIGSDYVVRSFRAVLGGTMVSYGDTSPYAGNTCSVNGLANPDNLVFVDGFHALLIGEDTETGHQNDVLWAYDVVTGKLERVLSSPYGAEITSTSFYPNLNGWAYVRAVIQHPYTESDEDMLESDDEERSYDGTLGPMPAMD